MGKFFGKNRSAGAPYAYPQTARLIEAPVFSQIVKPHSSLSIAEMRLYGAMRESVPLIDAALQKIVRLTGGFSVGTERKRSDTALKRFSKEISSGSQTGFCGFIDVYLEQLLTYGNAVGEIIPFRDGRGIASLYNASLESIELNRRKNPVSFDLSLRGAERQPVAHPELVLFSALNPPAGEIAGVSLLAGLPAVSEILLKIYRSIGKNFERMGNLRYAVTYRPGNDAVSQGSAKDRAVMIAKEWSDAMQSAEHGAVKDFIAVGDVDIRVIGADNQIIDSEVPVRQLLEQIVAKLSLPPFLLGLSWSSTERMSAEQADLLTSELEYYRRLLTPVIEKICRTFLRMNGFDDEPVVNWENINLKDEVELARAELYRSQAQKIEESLT